MHETHTLPLSQQRTLVVKQQANLDVLQVISADGSTCFSVVLTPAGPLLKFEGALMLQATGDLAVSAERVAIHGREGVSISSGGDAHIEVAGDLHSNARIQNITAGLGNVNLKANDDVKLDGERVLVNCVDT